MNTNELKQQFSEFREVQKQKRLEREEQYKHTPILCSVEKLDRKRYYKPTTTEYSKVISPSVANNPTVITLDELKQIITNGNAFSPALYFSEQGGLKQNKNFVCTQSIWLDFDIGYELSEVLQRLKIYGFNVNVYYHTFSHTDKQHKFRIGIILDTVVFNPEMYVYILNGFLKLFPEKFLIKNKKTGKKSYVSGLDKACMKPASMFVGTDKEFKILSYVPNRLLYVKSRIDTLYKDPKQGNRSVKTFNVCDNQNFTYFVDAKNMSVSDRLSVIYRDKMIKMRINVQSYIIYNRDAHQSSLSYENACNELTFRLLERVNFNHLINNVLIVNDFVNERELSNNELFGLLTNYKHFKGGLQYCEQVMQYNDSIGLTQYKEKDYVMLRQIQNSDYNPMNLVEFSDYNEAHTSIYTCAKLQKTGSIIKLSDKPRITLSEGEKLFNEALTQAITKHTEKTLITAPTGLGKTRFLIKNISHKTSGIVIAVPTHKHIKEFRDELTNIGLVEYEDYITTPEIPYFKTPEFNSVLWECYENEDFSGAKDHIRSIYTNTSANHLPEDHNKAQQYLDKLSMFYTAMNNDFVGTVITTHRTMFYYDFPAKYTTHIFDEDFLSTGLIEVKTLTLNEINRLKKVFDKHLFKNQLIMSIDEQLNGIKINKHDIEAYFNNLLNKNEGVYEHNHTLPIQFLNTVLMDEVNNSSKGLLRQFKHFLRSKGYYVQNSVKAVYTLYFGSKIELREDKNYIVLSATASKPLYEYLGFVVNNECENIEQTGKLIQHTRYSYTKQGINNAKKLPEIPENSTILTFKQYVNDFKKYYSGSSVSDSVYFFNSTGSNDYTGTDLHIVGTPVLNPATLIIIALECELNIDTSDITKLKEFVKQDVTYNNLQFTYNTYTDEVLRNLHLSTVEGELKQIVGRARLLRTDATVNLYSNFPLYEASNFVW